MKLNEMNVAETHLFIIWETARLFEHEIINDISLNFSIIQTFRINWSPYRVSRNYSRFYGAKLPSKSEKVNHSGSGEFRLVVVEDRNPFYRYTETSKGKELVNYNVFAAKERYRHLTGGGHKVHGTNSVRETRHDLFLLLGLTTEEFRTRYDNVEDSNTKLYTDLYGDDGWKNVTELVKVLSECGENVVMNFHRLNESLCEEKTIDIYSKNPTSVHYYLGGNITNDKFYRMTSDVVVGGRIFKVNVITKESNLLHESMVRFIEKHGFLNSHLTTEIESIWIIIRDRIFQSYKSLDVKLHQKKESQIQAQDFKFVLDLKLLSNFLHSNKILLTINKREIEKNCLNKILEYCAPFVVYKNSSLWRNFILTFKQKSMLHLIFFPVLSKKIELNVVFGHRYFHRRFIVSLGSGGPSF